MKENDENGVVDNCVVSCSKTGGVTRLGSLMLIKLQRNLKMVSVNAAKAEKINEMVYGEIKDIGRCS